MTSPYPSQQSDLPRMIIIHKSLRKTGVQQTEIERRKCSERVQRNAKTFETMTQILRAVTGRQLAMKTLLSLAKCVAQAKQIKIDRAAIRMKTNLICWFCENVEIQSLVEKHDDVPLTPPEKPTEFDAFGEESDFLWWDRDSEEN